LAEFTEGEMAVNAPEQVIDRDMFLKAEIIEQATPREMKLAARLSHGCAELHGTAVRVGEAERTWPGSLKAGVRETACRSKADRT
jgi:hypothetical protein